MTDSEKSEEVQVEGEHAKLELVPETSAFADEANRFEAEPAKVAHVQPFSVAEQPAEQASQQE